MMRPIAVLIAALFLLAGLAGTALAQSPVKITADSFVINEADGEAVFTGNVEVVPVIADEGSGPPGQVVVAVDERVVAEQVAKTFGGVHPMSLITVGGQS